MTKFVCAKLWYLECGDIEAVVYTTDGKLELVSLDPVHAGLIQAVQSHGRLLESKMVQDGSVHSISTFKL